MTDTPPTGEILHAYGRAFGRLSVVVLLIVALYASLAAITQSDPDAGAQIAAAVTLATGQGFEITIFDPLLLGALGWAVAPVPPILWRLVAGVFSRTGGEEDE